MLLRSLVQALIESTAERLSKLSGKWEEVRAPLLQQYRSAKASNESRETETTLLLEQIRSMRERMREVADETRSKDDLYKQLVRDGEGGGRVGRGVREGKGGHVSQNT